MEKDKVRRAILEEIIKEDWDSHLIEKLSADLNEKDREARIMSRVSDELPKIAARICGVELFDLISGSRKAEVIMALKLVYKELKENHNYTLQRIADRFNRGTHDNTLSALRSINNLLETKDPEATRLHYEFQNEIAALKLMLSM